MKIMRQKVIIYKVVSNEQLQHPTEAYIPRSTSKGAPENWFGTSEAYYPQNTVSHTPEHGRSISAEGTEGKIWPEKRN